MTQKTNKIFGLVFLINGIAVFSVGLVLYIFISWSLDFNWFYVRVWALNSMFICGVAALESSYNHKKDKTT